jgi:hypothetical protein
MNRKLAITGTLCALLVGAGVVLAQRPKDNISERRHPHLAEAQRLCTEAWGHVSKAQEANEFDMDGHAQKAKELLDEVNKQLKMAAEAANRH